MDVEKRYREIIAKHTKGKRISWKGVAEELKDLLREKCLPDSFYPPEDEEEEEGHDIDIWNPPTDWESDPFLKSYIPYRRSIEEKESKKK